MEISAASGRGGTKLGFRLMQKSGAMPPIQCDQPTRA